MLDHKFLQGRHPPPLPRSPHLIGPQGWWAALLNICLCHESLHSLLFTAPLYLRPPLSSAVHSSSYSDGLPDSTRALPPSVAQAPGKASFLKCTSDRVAPQLRRCRGFPLLLGQRPKWLSRPAMSWLLPPPPASFPRLPPSSCLVLSQAGPL